MKPSSPGDWPRTVDAAVRLLVWRLPEKDKEIVKSSAEEDLIRLHHGWGTGIRNGFGLWAGNSELLASSIALGGLGWPHPDEASGVIIKAVWNHLNGLPLDYHQRTVWDIYPCEVCGGEAQVSRWHEDEPVPPTHPKCRQCARKTSPDYLRRQEEMRRNNEVADQAFKRARQLGELIHDTYVIVTKGASWPSKLRGQTDDDCLLAVARVLYTSDERFRRLWDEVKGEQPGEKHLGWLRLWKRL